MNHSQIESMREELFVYEDDLQIKGVLVGIAPAEMVGVQLSPIAYTCDGETRVKILISVELTTGKKEIDDDVYEEVADTVSDWLKSKGLNDKAKAIGIDPEVIDFDVEFQEV